jgi:hypothetical protein
MQSLPTPLTSFDTLILTQFEAVSDQLERHRAFTVENVEMLKANNKRVSQAFWKVESNRVTDWGARTIR